MNLMPPAKTPSSPMAIVSAGAHWRRRDNQYRIAPRSLLVNPLNYRCIALVFVLLLLVGCFQYLIAGFSNIVDNPMRLNRVAGFVRRSIFACPNQNSSNVAVLRTAHIVFQVVAYHHRT